MSDQPCRLFLILGMLGLSLPFAPVFADEPKPSEPVALEKPPAQVDLRPRLEHWGLEPRSQGKRPTCSVVTFTGALEFAVANARHRGGRLSVDFLNWSANQTGRGVRDGGFFSEMWAGFTSHGICAEDKMPYQSEFDAGRNPDRNARDEAKEILALGLRLNWIKKWNVTTGLSDHELAGIKATLHRGWPVCGGFRWPKQARWIDDVLQLCEAEEVFDGHSVLLTGYRDDASQPGGGVFIFRNSGGDGKDGSMPYSYAQSFMNDAVWVESSPAFTPGQSWPDDQGVHINAHGGGILFHQGNYYWFGEHKIAGKAGNAAQVGVGVYVSKDLHHWENKGIALPVSEDPKSEIAKGCILERPKVIHNRTTGKFVMWFHLEPAGMGYQAARSGVAVADEATGPYIYQGSFRPNAGVWPLNVPETSRKQLGEEETKGIKALGLNGGPHPQYPKDRVYRRDFAGGQMARDMNLFVDSDGKAYQIYASEENGTLHISQLSEDYLKPAGRYIRIFPGDFNEAPAMFKKDGKYYLITSGCSGWAPNAARSAVADSVLGSWTALGNPVRGSQDQMNRTFESQSTFVLPAPSHPGEFIFLADRWRPENPVDGRYVWLPVQWQDGKPVLKWLDRWDLSFFNKP